MATSGAQPGNNNARKGRAWTEALKRALARYSGESVDKGLDMLADRQVKAAMDGDDKAAAEIRERIGDRLEGKVAQQVVLNGDEEGGPVSLNGVVCFVESRKDER